MNITFEQEVKLQLVALAEYLQCKPLSDLQVKLYAKDLIPLGAEGLHRAIALLKEDPEVWAGRMPLPAKLKQYAHGDLNSIAIVSAGRIMALTSVREAYEKLLHWELGIAKEYGLSAIVSRLAEQSPTIFAQLRESIKAYLKQQREDTCLDLHRSNQQALQEKTRPEDLLGAAGEGSLLSPELHVPREDTWPD